MYADILVANDIDFRRGPSDELILDHCPWCGDGDPHGSNCYVNDVSGFVYCHRCGTSGGPSFLGRYFGVEIGVSEDEVRWGVFEKFADSAQSVLWSDAGHEVLDFLRARGMSDDTITAARLGCVPRGTTIIESMLAVFEPDVLRASGLFTDRKCFFEDMLVIPFVRHGRVETFQGRSMVPGKASRYYAMPGRQLPLYNVDTVAHGCNVVFVEGALDALVVAQETDRFSVVGLPGARSHLAQIVDTAAVAKKVIIAFDDDKAGHEASSKVMGKVGPKSTQVFPTEGKDWTEMHQNGGDVRGALDSAFLASKRLVSLSEAGRRHREATAGRRFRTGMTGLDLTTGGFRPGQVVVPIARSGSGKSTLLANWIYNMADANMLMASLELTSGEFYSMLSKVHLGNNPSHSDTEVYDRYPNLMIYDDNSIDVDHVDDLLAEYEDETGRKAQVLYVDYLQYAARGGEGSEYERVTKAIMTLKSVAKRHRVLVIAPSQVNRLSGASGALNMSSVRGAGTVEETADFLLGIYKDEEPDSPKGAVNISILKSRAGGQGRELFLRLSPLSLRLIDQSDALAMKRCDEEWDHVSSGGTYDTWVNSQNLADIWKEAK